MWSSKLHGTIIQYAWTQNSHKALRSMVLVSFFFADDDEATHELTKIRLNDTASKLQLTTKKVCLSHVLMCVCTFTVSFVCHASEMTLQGIFMVSFLGLTVIDGIQNM